MHKFIFTLVILQSAFLFCSTGPKTCGTNEVLSTCRIKCPPQTCDSTFTTYDCSAPDNEVCEPGCDCLPEFLRNGTENDPCIPSSQCSFAPPECKEGEVYNECGSACPPTCENRGQNLICTAQCVPGCYCANTTIRAPDGSCVEPKDCPPPECKEGEVYNACGSACPPTCENRGQDLICTLQCVPGCYCANTTIRAPDGSCVEPEDCPPPECKEGEVYNACGSACPPTCENRGQDLICTLQCVPGCYCANTTIRAPDGSCVEPEKCPPPECKEGEVYNECGSACPPTCDNRGQDLICTAQCVPGCYCANTTIRAPDGSCVEPSDCPPVCKQGEVYNECGSACPPTCENRGRNVICTRQCVRGCFCANNTIRAPDGSCVAPKDCPKQKCGPNEVLEQCSKCTQSCDNPNEKCTDGCEPKCSCISGYYRNSNNECVKAGGKGNPCEEKKGKSGVKTSSYSYSKSSVKIQN